MKKSITLDRLPIGHGGVLETIGGTGALRCRLLDMGLIRNTVVQCLGRSPGGDPSAFLIRGAVIAIRAADSQHIWVTPC